MDVLVMLEENVDHTSVLAHVSSVPSPLHAERPSRDVVTMYGAASPETLALALAAAVESHRDATDGQHAIRHLGVWAERGAVGDSAWRDQVTGQLMTRDLDIPLERLRATAGWLLNECGPTIGRLAAGLSMPDWPEGARRAINVSIASSTDAALPMRHQPEAWLDLFREADAMAYDSGEGD